MSTDTPRFSAFDGFKRIASGPLAEVALQVRRAERDATRPILIFDDRTGAPLDIDTRGTDAEIAARFAASETACEPGEPRGRGRPKLGVVAREVTLLPRHWQWLAAQPGGASITLRRLVEAASRNPEALLRSARERTYRFMSALGGDLPGFEAATRALFAGDQAQFEQRLHDWPKDVREHALRLLTPA
ncbi:MAG: DUF2239 family protein [Steroidobacteraceae bacterium]